MHSFSSGAPPPVITFRVSPSLSISTHVQTCGSSLNISKCIIRPIYPAGFWPAGDPTFQPSPVGGRRRRLEGRLFDGMQKV